MCGKIRVGPALMIATARTNAPASGALAQQATQTSAQPAVKGSTLRVHVARFPLYNLMNNEDTFVQLSVTPHRKLTLRSEAHSLNLANASDLWYVGGGAFQKQTFGYTGRPSAGEKGFATVFDVSAD